MREHEMRRVRRREVCVCWPAHGLWCTERPSELPGLWRTHEDDKESEHVRNTPSAHSRNVPARRKGHKCTKIVYQEQKAQATAQIDAQDRPVVLHGRLTGVGQPLLIPYWALAWKGFCVKSFE